MAVLRRSHRSHRWSPRRRPDNAVDAWDGGTAASARGRRRYDRGGERPIRVVPRLAVTLTGARLGPAERTSRPRRTHALVLPGTAPLHSSAAAAANPLLCALAVRFRRVKPRRLPSLYESIVNGIACQWAGSKHRSLRLGRRQVGATEGLPRRAAGPGAGDPAGEVPGHDALQHVSDPMMAVFDEMAAAVETGTA